MKISTVLKTITNLTIAILLLLGSRSDIQAQAPGDGEIRFDRAVFAVGAQVPPGAAIQDRDGLLWFGTNGAGLMRYDGYDLKVYKPGGPDSLSVSIIYTLYEDSDGLIWISTRGGGLNSYNKESDIFTQYKHDPDDPNSISSNEFGFLSTEFIQEDQDGILWIGTQGGLNAFNKETGTFTRYLHNPDDPNSLSHDDVRTILVDRQGIIWVGTNGGGLNRFDKQTGTFTHYVNDPADLQSLGGNIVNSVLEDGDGVLWVATEGAGLHRFDRGMETFTQYAYNPDNPNSLKNDNLGRNFEEQKILSLIKGYKE